MSKQMQRDLEILDREHPEWSQLSNDELYRRYWMYFTDRVAGARLDANLRILTRITFWPIIRFIDRLIGKRHA